MASRHTTRWLQALRPVRLQHRAYHPSLVLRADAASTPKSPTLLSTVKQDLKTAMRAKDAPRLAVLRSIITTTNNAAKTDSPIATNAQLVALLRKNLRSSREAAAEANAAGRPDLAEKEDAQAAIIEEYIAASGVTPATESQVLEIIQKIVADAREKGVEAKSIIGLAMRSVSEALEGRDVQVDMKRINAMVKEAISK